MRTIPIFQIFYRTTFTVLFIVLIALLLITPGDAVRQSLENHQFYYIFIIAGAYILTLILAVLIYASRLYTNHHVLVSIPKGWVPLGKGDATKSVRRMIAAGLTRSAVVAWDSKPKHLGVQEEEDMRLRRSMSERSSRRTTGDVMFRMGKKSKKAKRNEDEAAAAAPGISASNPPWGHISHAGWSSPSSPEFPDLPYRTVIVELPHLIEAKAVSLAPPESSFTPLEQEVVPDAQAVLLLQRPATMGLRDYLGRLAALNLIDPPSLCATFLVQYEKARFSPSELSEEAFRRLMTAFANLLQGMTKLDEQLLSELVAEEDTNPDSASLSSSLASYYKDVDENSAASSSSPSQVSLAGSTGSEGTIRTAPPINIRRSRGSSAARNTAFTRMSPRRASSSRYFSASAGNQDSVSPMSSSDSVIRLARPDDETGLPFTINLPER